MSVFGVILVRFFPHSDRIRTRITPNTDTFHAVSTTNFQYLIEKIIYERIGWIDQLICSQYKLSECFCCKRASYKILSYIWLNVYPQKQLPQVFCEKSVPRNFAKFIGKHLCQNIFFNKVAKKETLAQVSSCEFCEISKNTIFTEHLWAILLSRLLKESLSSL